MPPAEVEASGSLVTALLQDQRPELSHLPVVAIGFGWDNFSFRVGDDLVARLPRRKAAVRLVENEVRWLPEIASRLPLPVPAPLFAGDPGRGYPWPWTLAPWIPGERASSSAELDAVTTAGDLGAFLRALHRPAPRDAPRNPYRGIPLQERDRATRERIQALASRESEPALSLWNTAISEPPYEGPPVWIHGDLHPANLLTIDGRLSGVVDFGDITSGDPATDLAVAWMLLPAGDRTRFRDAYGGADDDAWTRARAWALSLALAMLFNSADNEEMESIGRTTLSSVLEDA